MERWWEGGWYTSGTHRNLDKVWGLSDSSFPKSNFFFKKAIFLKIIYFKEIKTLYQDVHCHDL